MSEQIPFNLQILPWAVSRAGYRVEEFAIKYPKLQIIDWLEEKKKPTLKQLQDFSKKVYLPFGYLFLSEPPQEPLPFAFFRRASSARQALSPNVSDTIQSLQRRQDWLRTYLTEVEEASPLPFVGRYGVHNTVIDIVSDIRTVLGLEEEWNFNCRNIADTRKYLVRKIEEVGIFVVLNGVVENNTSRPIPVDECRGFVMVDAYAPFIFVNIADSPAAQIFTLVHEVAHIWLGQSAGFDLDMLLPADDPIELLCNGVAAEILVPAATFRRQWMRNSNFNELSRYFKVSQLVIARRAYDFNFINRDSYSAVYRQTMASWEAKKAESTDSGGNFYATAAGRISPRFAGYIDKAARSGTLLYRDAYQLTGLTAKTYQKFLDTLT